MEQIKLCERCRYHTITKHDTFQLDVDECKYNYTELIHGKKVHFTYDAARNSTHLCGIEGKHWIYDDNDGVTIVKIRKGYSL